MMPHWVIFQITQAFCGETSKQSDNTLEGTISLFLSCLCGNIFAPDKCWMNKVSTWDRHGQGAKSWSLFTCSICAERWSLRTHWNWLCPKCSSVYQRKIWFSQEWKATGHKFLSETPGTYTVSLQIEYANKPGVHSGSRGHTTRSFAHV